MIVTSALLGLDLAQLAMEMIRAVIEVVSARQQFRRPLTATGHTSTVGSVHFCDAA